MAHPPIRTTWLSRPGWSPFGRVGPNGNSHGGMDYYVPAGTPVYATGPGKVASIGYGGDPRMGFGHNITLHLDDGRKSIDAHFQASSSALGLKPGRRVNENTVIGHVGNTGNAHNVFWQPGASRLSHLHHECWLTRSGPRVDPVAYYRTAAPATGTAYPISAKDDMPTTKEIANDLLNYPAFDKGPSVSAMLLKVNAVHAAIFEGGGSMEDGGRSISASLAGLVKVADQYVAEFAPVQRADADGTPYSLAVRQDNANTNTMVLSLLAQVASLSAAVSSLATGEGADPAAIQAAAKAGAEEALAGLTLAPVKK
jgi:hypothetical protein